MKSFITIIASALMSIFTINVANATVKTVSNNVNTPGQYSTLAGAITYAGSGDTIYLTPSPITYGDIRISNSHLTIIGGGYNNPATQDNLTTIVGNIWISGNNSYFTCSGLQVTNVYYDNYTNYNQSSYITISLCNISGYLSIGGSNWVVQNCIIADLRIGFGQSNSVYSLQNAISNTAVRNNIVTGAVTGIPFLSQNYFYHNIFEGHINNLSNCTFNDNIFFYSDLANSTGQSNCVFNNNGVYSGNASAELNYMSANGNISNNNVSSSISPIFNNSVSSAQNFAGLLNYDWTIVSGAPENNTATDGTDMGIYGGSFPMPYYSGFPTNQNFTGTTQIPQMVYMNIPTPSVGIGQPLINVEFIARKQK